MKNKLNVFTSELFGSIRMVTVNNEPYFVAADIAKILGYKNTSDAIHKHCKGIVKHEMLTNGGMQQLNVITRRDVVKLILRSKLPNAEKFEEWIFEEVLPSATQNNKRTIIDKEELTNMVSTIQRKIEERNQRILYLEKIIEEQKPLVAFAERMMRTDDN